MSIFKIINYLLNKIITKNLILYFFNKKYKKVTKAIHNGHDFYFHTPNWVTLYRAETFSTKEPETLNWIDKFDHGSIFWDIGANVGLYSIYATKIRNVKTYSFEPSVFNLEFLAKNIILNKLQDQINIIPIALSDHSGISTFNMSNIEWGGALSTFSKTYDQNGNNLEIEFKYNTVGITANDACNFFNIPKPNYIKIDVDGIEHLILSGMSNILDETKEILIELNDNFIEQAKKSYEFLNSQGFTLYDKFIDSNNKNISANQIWRKV
jgi:FkbM family methyltransferase